MKTILPKKVFLTRGIGQHKEKLVSFELALRDAGISPFNLVKVSSIFPPGCRLVSRQDGVKSLRPGQIVFLVMSENATDKARRLISASIGLAIPEDGRIYGYLAEHESIGRSEKAAGRYTEALAVEMLATKLGRTFEPRRNRPKGRAGKTGPEALPLKTASITQTAMGKKGLWTTALAAAVFAS